MVRSCFLLELNEWRKFASPSTSRAILHWTMQERQGKPSARDGALPHSRQAVGSWPQVEINMQQPARVMDIDRIRPQLINDWIFASQVKSLESQKTKRLAMISSYLTKAGRYRRSCRTKYPELQAASNQPSPTPTHRARKSA